jgi:hypothetical protein
VAGLSILSPGTGVSKAARRGKFAPLPR